MSKELVIAIVNLMFISACMGFLACFFAMGGFNYQPKEENKFEGDTEIKVEVHYDPPQTEAEPVEPEVIEVKKTRNSIRNQWAAVHSRRYRKCDRQ